GYEISLGPSRDPEAVEEKCTAAIYNSTGRVVFRTNGFNVVLDGEQTGKDFDGDGKPEVVFRTDTGGGMHCCWGYIVYSLSPKPHKLFEIDMAGRVDFEKDKDGRMVIWKRTAGPYGFTRSEEHTSELQSPYDLVCRLLLEKKKKIKEKINIKKKKKKEYNTKII